MPTYLLHGFRWTRLNIRIYIILYDLEDAASEWIMAPATSRSLLNDFYAKFDFIPHCSPPPSPPLQPDTGPYPIIHHDKPIDDSELSSTLRCNNSRVSLRSIVRKQKSRLHILRSEKQEMSRVQSKNKPLAHQAFEASRVKAPVSFNDWSPVKLVEQYDPDEKFMCSQPYAFVADYLVKVDLSLTIEEEMRKYAIFRTEQSRLHKERKRDNFSACKLGEEEMSTKKPSQKVDEYWFNRLHKELEKDSEIGWHVVYCGDQEREIPTWAERKLSHEDSNIQNSLKTPWSGNLKSLFKDNRNDVEK